MDGRGAPACPLSLRRPAPLAPGRGGPGPGASSPNEMPGPAHAADAPGTPLVPVPLSRNDPSPFPAATARKACRHSPSASGPPSHG